MAIDYSAQRKEKIAELIEQKKPFCIIDDSGHAWNDMLVPDASNDFALRFIAKWNMTQFVNTQPTFGNAIWPQGLVMVTIPYDKIIGVIEMNVNEEMLNKFEEAYPKYYEFWKNSNKTEAAFVNPTSEGLQKSEKVKQWELEHASEIEARNRTSAIDTGWGQEEGVNL